MSYENSIDPVFAHQISSYLGFSLRIERNLLLYDNEKMVGVHL